MKNQNFKIKKYGINMSETNSKFLRDLKTHTHGVR